MSLGVALIGCGLIGKKRAKVLAPARLVACVDMTFERAEDVARAHRGAVAERDWRNVVNRQDVDIVIVATTNDALAAITLAAVECGKHVLVEKPAARSTTELDSVIRHAVGADVRVRVGFNHRYHPAIRQCRALIDEGALGPLMFLRARYGHGGRLGYESEWRANPDKSGGGELIDQGVHVIDLARWFLGDFTAVEGFAHTYFWQMPVDDNAFMLLRTADERTAWMHVSCTEWKNLFSLEIYGRDGKLQVDGLGGSYGTERLTYYRMLPQMGPPETTTWEYSGPDTSWEEEFSEFLDDIQLGREPAANLGDARAALAVVELVYQNNQDDDPSRAVSPVGGIV
jgi:predicted dehydrogenase